MFRIAIDGACRRNGKPDCVSSGGVFIQRHTEADVFLHTLTDYEIQSTNQRGELIALLAALNYIYNFNDSAQVITDSEYIFNTMSKEWFNGWESRGWKTAVNEPVKNSDLWSEIVNYYRMCVDKGIDITFYHIKGHCIPFGKVTANKLLDEDKSGAALYNAISEKYDSVASTTRAEKIKEANELSKRNNGFVLDDEILKAFIVMNTMADAIATKCVDEADACL